MMHAADNRHSSAILVRSPDSDIFFILLCYAAEVNATIIFDTEYGNNGRLLDLSALSTAYGQEYCERLFSLMHLPTVLQQVPLCILVRSNQLKNFSHFQQSLRELGESWDLNENAMVDLEHFVCAMYGRVRYHDVHRLRYDMFMKKCQLDFLDANKDADLKSSSTIQTSSENEYEACKLSG